MHLYEIIIIMKNSNFNKFLEQNMRNSVLKRCEACAKKMVIIFFVDET